MFTYTAGVFLEKATNEKCYNTTVFISPSGELLGKYRKIHLYDVEIEGRIAGKESDSILPGDSTTLIQTPDGIYGLAICYDVRFPELFRKMSSEGAQVLFIPAAFPIYTGYLHWELLMRTRAVENQCYVVAAAQFDVKDEGGLNTAKYGDSMIIDPLGRIVARAPERECIIYADVDCQTVEELRETFPFLQHKRTDLY